MDGIWSGVWDGVHAHLKGACMLERHKVFVLTLSKIILISDKSPHKGEVPEKGKTKIH